MKGREGTVDGAPKGGNGMRTGLAIGLLALATALAACSRTLTRTLDPPTAEEQAREAHGGIVGAADTLLMGDRLAWLSAVGEVERTNTTCRGDTCALASSSGAS